MDATEQVKSVIGTRRRADYDNRHVDEVSELGRLLIIILDTNTLCTTHPSDNTALSPAGAVLG